MNILDIIQVFWPIFAALVAIVVGMVIWGLRAEARSKTNEMIANEARRIAISNTGALAEFREKVAQDYVTTNALIQIRSEITEALNRLGDRLDKIFIQERG